MKILSKKQVILCLVGVLITGVVIVAVFFLQSRILKLGSGEKPAFSFNNQEAPGWSTGGNNWPDPNEISGTQEKKDSLPRASIIIYEGINGKPSDSGSCFVMYAYFSKKINLADKLRQNEKEIVENDYLGSVQVGVSQVSLPTFEGQKNIELRNYEHRGSGAKDIQRGAAYGYASLEDGFVQVEVVCQEAAQLDSALPAVRAVRLDVRNTEK